jgi:hypothetical protein
MLVDFTQLILAMLAMLAASTAADLLRGRILRQPGERSRQFSDHLLMNLLFFVMSPAMLYAWFYPVVPFSGYRAGLFLALAFFLLAVTPTFAAYRLQVSERSSALMGHLFWLLLKYLAVYGLLAGIYHP